ncbi:MAG: RHS repeat-associated core domain-containing protein, partial [Sedimentisphaerales bacterium]
PYMFTGRRFDIETGLYYYRARYYNPHIGRFMQTDPVGYSAAMNLYTYCRNNPLAFVDPSGLWAYRSFEWIKSGPYSLLVKLHNEDGTVADYRYFIDVADWVASDWYTSDCCDVCDVRVGDFDDVIVNTPPLPWWTELGEIGIVITIPSLSGVKLGGGIDLVWIPGEGWESYVYGQGSLAGVEASAHFGVGIVVNIQDHEDYEGPYANVSVMAPVGRPFGAGIDVSQWPGSPTAIQLIFGVGGGASINIQYYRITTEALRELMDWIDDQEWLTEEKE